MFSRHKSTKETVKTIVQEMPDVSGGPVVTNARAFYTTRAAAGALSARHFLRLLLKVACALFFGANTHSKTSGASRREIADMCLFAIRP